MVRMKPRLVVLDGHTLTRAQPHAQAPQGEPTWESLASLVELTVHPRIAGEKVIETLKEASLVLTNKVVLSKETIQALPKLRYIGLLSTGVNVVDLDAARDRNIPVTNIPGYSTASVAQHVFALLLELTVHTASHGMAVRQGQWASNPDFCFTVAPTLELAGKTLALVGMGKIGQQVAHVAHALGMKLATLDRAGSKPIVETLNIATMDLDTLLAEADVVSLHCPLNAQTRHIINAQRLARMKPGAFLINTGRGELIDEAALAHALNQRQLAGAGLDVLSEEPPARDNPLIAAPRCLITPHIAWATAQARNRLMEIAVANVQAFLAGSPENVVNA